MYYLITLGIYLSLIVLAEILHNLQFIKRFDKENRFYEIDNTILAIFYVFFSLSSIITLINLQSLKYGDFLQIGMILLLIFFNYLNFTNKEFINFTIYNQDVKFSYKIAILFYVILQSLASTNYSNFTILQNIVNILNCFNSYVIIFLLGSIENCAIDTYFQQDKDLIFQQDELLENKRKIFKSLKFRFENYITSDASLFNKIFTFGLAIVNLCLFMISFCGIKSLTVIRVISGNDLNVSTYCMIGFFIVALINSIWIIMDGKLGLIKNHLKLWN
ncbi:hypothetical protein PACTADRAFT_4419 [Pachysolen tannophilus NRRL Y-2460]|uniref:Uncharacterized protein n=1 Tax=Pachysolen tannophilus NRRL Y-2460 TaxID=669874 RepID=A0A1E4TS32_PACTA|nr:hypothetical protein PACTADRAFT_4419 [Pachysolen tannophilus NRRL Y-2460]